MSLRVQAQTETIGQLKHDAETVSANSTALGESEATCAMLTSEWDSVLEALNRVNMTSRETWDRLDGADVLIADLPASLIWERFRSNRGDDRIYDYFQQLLVLLRLIDTLSESVQQDHELVASAIDVKLGRARTVFTFALNESVGVLCGGIDGLTEEFMSGSSTFVHHGSSFRGPPGTPGAGPLF